MIPGELLPEPGDIELNAGLPRIRPYRRQYRRPADPGGKPLPFRRNQCRAVLRSRVAKGQRLDIAAGTAVRFEPGQSRELPWSLIAAPALSMGSAAT